MKATNRPCARVLRCFALLCTLSVTACDDDGAAEPLGDDEGGDEGAPVYVLFSTVDTADDRFGYVVTMPSIDADETIDLAKGIEVPGGGQVYAPNQEGYFLVGSGESPEFTRYDVDEDGSVKKGKTVSFANLGVDDVWRHMIFHSPTQAYFLDLTQLQIIRFNPKIMTIDGTTPVEDFSCEGETQTEYGMPIKRDDGYYFPRSCWDPDVTSRGASLVHLDPETDEVTVTHDERCMGMQVGFLADSGDAYWFADHDASHEWSLQRRDAPHDCGLRLRAGDKTFDPDWELDLTTRTGGASAVASVPAGGSSIWVRVFQEDAFEGEVPVSMIEWTVKVWRWGLLDVASDAPVRLDEDSDLVVFYGPPILVDDRAFAPATTFSDDGDVTVLQELKTSGVRDVLSVRGELRKVLRVR